MTERPVALKLPIVALGLGAAVDSFCCGLTLGLAFKSRDYPASLWIPGLLGLAAVLLAAGFVGWVRKLG